VDGDLPPHSPLKGEEEMREIKFRLYDQVLKRFIYEDEYVKYPMAALKGLVMFPQQFTGLKDKNGKEIYEGDILDHYATSGAVIFEDGMFCLNMQAKVNFGYRQPLCYIDVNQAEIIGNIYENPELLAPKE